MVTSAWMAKPRKDTIARRPFLISLVCAALKSPLLQHGVAAREGTGEGEGEVR